MANAAQLKHEKHTTSVVEITTLANDLAQELFGSQADMQAVDEIYDYIEEANAAGVKEFTADVKAVIEKARVAFKTTSPTPEQVFFLFDKIWGDE